MLFNFSCQEYEKEKSEIQSTFDRYKSALLSANGKLAADEVCSQTIQWYEKTRNDALSMKRFLLNRVDLLRKFSILRLRHEFSKKTMEKYIGFNFGVTCSIPESLLESTANYLERRVQ